jgi:hypothetical protein
LGAAFALAGALTGAFFFGAGFSSSSSSSSSSETSTTLDLVAGFYRQRKRVRIAEERKLRKGRTVAAFLAFGEWAEGFFDGRA